MAMAVCSCTMSFLIVISMGYLWLSNAHTFYVGGDEGWTLKPSENYTHWAERNRFQINDSIVFKYKKGHDSVLIVNENGYYKCNKDAPFETFRDGNSTFKFDESGTFHFISGHEQNCEKGQKFIIVVLSEHHHNTTTLFQPSSPSPSPTNKAPSHSPSPSPTQEPKNNAPSNSPSPTQAPTNNVPSHSPSPSNFEPPIAPRHAPIPSPTPSRTPPLSNSPSPSPAAKIPTVLPDEPPAHSPSPSPHNELVPTQAPTHLLSPSPSPTAKQSTHAHVEPPTNQSPSSPRAPTPVPKNSDGPLQPDVQHDAPTPHVHSPASTPHHAPAPAPSAAPAVHVPFFGLVTYILMFLTFVTVGYL